MARISLKEQYDNKDVIQQIYDLRDGYTELENMTEEAVQASKDAVATVGQYNDRIDRAETVAGEAKSLAEQAQTTANTASGKADTAISTAQNGFVDFEYISDPAQVTLKQTKGNAGTVSHAMPIANASQSGIMNAQTYQGITDLNNRVTALEGQARTYYVVFTSQDPSQSEIATLVTQQKGSAPIKGDYAEDIAKNLRYGYDGTTWLLVRGSTASAFTNESAGLIKGKNQDGCVFAEADGTGSVVGWDAIKSHADTYGSKVDVLESDMSTAKADITNLKTGVQNAQNTADTANTTANTADSKADANASSITQLQSKVNENIASISALDTGKQTKMTGVSVQLPAGGWNTSSKSQTVTVTGMKLDSLVWVAPDAGSWTPYGEAGVRATAQNTDSLTFVCDEIPTATLTANIIMG